MEYISNLRVLISLFPLIFSNFLGVLISIIAVVAFYPGTNGVIVVNSNTKFRKMFTFASFCCKAISHIEGTILY